MKILKGAAAALVVDKKLLKPVSVFLFLKAYYTNGTIIDYSKKIETLAGCCYMCKSSFYTRLKELIQLKLITITGNRLNLVSYKKLYEIIGLEDEVEKYNYRKIAARPEYILRTVALKENLDKQEHIIKEKIKKQNQGSRPLYPTEIQGIK